MVAVFIVPCPSPVPIICPGFMQGSFLSFIRRSVNRGEGRVFGFILGAVWRVPQDPPVSFRGSLRSGRATDATRPPRISPAPLTEGTWYAFGIHVPPYHERVVKQKRAAPKMEPPRLNGASRSEFDETFGHQCRAGCDLHNIYTRT